MNINNTHKGKVWVNHKLKKGFLAVPKCASSGIRGQFKFLDEKNIENVPKDYKIFTIIRNPINRFVSAYIEVFIDCKDYPGGRFRHNIPKEFNGHNIFKELDLLQKNKNKNDIQKFLFYLDKIENDWHFYEPHCIPFIHYISDNNNKVHKNIKIFKIENIKELEIFMNKKIKIGNTSEAPLLKKELIDYIKKNKNIEKRIINLYKSDFDFFNK